MKKIMVLFLLFTSMVGCVAEATPKTSSASMEPKLDAKNVVVMDFDTGEVVYAKNPKEKVQMASTTKIMTALLFAENSSPEDIIAYTESAIEQPSTSIYRDILGYVKVGDTMVAEDVMDGLLLRSGNDMAVMIAESVSGSEESFSKLMDSKAVSLGMVDTDFYTASGLDTDIVLNGNNHYTTAYDMCLLAKAAFSNDWVMNTVSKETSTIELIGRGEFSLENSNKNLGKNGCLGGKTGFTTKAQRCLISLYEKGDSKFISVVLGGSESFFDDTNDIVEFADTQEKNVVKKKGESLYSCKVSISLFGKNLFTKDMDVDICLNEDLLRYDNKDNELFNDSKVVVELNSAKDFKADSVGFLVVKDGFSEKQYELVCNKTYADVLKVFIFSPETAVVGIVIVVIVLTILKRRNKRRK